MVENQLGFLFSQIAESIRGGLGDIGKLKPNAFPAKIDDIVALIGTGGGGSGGGESGSSGELTFASGTFSPSTDGERVTINHGLGVMPDLVIVHLISIHHAETFEEAAESLALVASWGMKSSFQGSAHSGNIHTIFGISRANGIDNTSEVDQANGFIYCPDNSCFQVGSTKDTGKLYAANIYKWIAISGMGGGGSDDPGESPEMIYYRSLAESLMTRNAEYMGDKTKMNLKGFVLSNGGTLGSLDPFSFAGFKYVEGMSFTDVMLVQENAFYGCNKLKVIDITVPASVRSSAFMQNSLRECPNVEAIIFRDGGEGLTSANVASAHGGNDSFFIYVPAAYYDTVTASLANYHVPKSRYRKLEDYPKVDKWYETNT